MTELNLSKWIDRRKDSIGPHADTIIKGVQEYEGRIEELQAKLAKAVEIAGVLSGAVEYDYHGNVADPEERQAIKELDELEGKDDE